MAKNNPFSFRLFFCLKPKSPLEVSLPSLLTQICNHLGYDDESSNKLKARAEAFFEEQSIFSTRALVGAATEVLLKEARLVVLWPFLRDLQQKTGLGLVLQPPNPVQPNPTELTGGKDYTNLWIELGNVKDSLVINSSNSTFECKLCGKSCLLRSGTDMKRHSNGPAHQARLVGVTKKKPVDKKEDKKKERSEEEEVSHSPRDEAPPKKKDKLERKVEGERQSDLVDAKQQDPPEEEEEEEEQVWTFPSFPPILLRRHVTNARGQDVEGQVPEGAVISYMCQWVDQGERRVGVMELLQHYPDLKEAIELFDEEHEVPQEIERIVKERRNGRWTEYWVQWRGYPEVCNTWQKVGDLGERK